MLSINLEFDFNHQKESRITTEKSLLLKIILFFSF